MPNPTSPELQKPAYILPFVIVAAGLSPLALNILVPVMPRLQTVFGISYGVAELTLSLYLFAFAFGQFIMGPLSDVYGRRPVMIAGLIGFAAGNLICAFAGSIEMLLIGRVVQALGASTGYVLSRAILRDLYSREKAASMLSIVVGLMVVAPMFAPALGGVVAEHFGWRTIFHILLGLVLIYLFACVLGLKETNKTPAHRFKLSELIGNFRLLLSLPAMRGYILVLGFSSGMFFGFLAGGPYIVIEVMGYPPSVYGFWFMLASLGYMSGNLISSRLVEKWGTDKLIILGNFIGVFATGGMLLIAATGTLSAPAFLFVPMMVVTFSNGLVISNATASAISLRPEIAGAGSGITGGTQLMIAALISNLVAHVQNGSAIPTMLAMFTCAVLAKIAMTYTRRHTA